MSIIFSIWVNNVFSLYQKIEVKASDHRLHVNQFLITFLLNCEAATKIGAECCLLLRQTKLNLVYSSESPLFSLAWLISHSIEVGGVGWRRKKKLCVGGCYLFLVQWWIVFEYWIGKWVTFISQPICSICHTLSKIFTLLVCVSWEI